MCRGMVVKYVSQSLGAGMELSFVAHNSAEASRLARELEEALRWRGLPAEALVLKPSSSEHMDIGSVLQVSMDVANGVGSIVTLASGIFQIMTKYRKGIVVNSGGERTEIAASRVTEARIKAALSKPQPRSKRRVKSKG
ncbi:MAG: hypothetical protein ABIO35_02530 [Nitrobacter sp.]